MESGVEVGVCLLIVKGDRFLVGRRKGRHGAGQWGFPGGHFEYGESFEGCVLREMREECGDSLKIKNIRFQVLYNEKDYMPKHSIHIGLVAEWAEGEPLNAEPDLCEGWEWSPLNNPPELLFPAGKIQLEAYKNGVIYKDA